MKLVKKIVLLWALLFTAPVVAAPSDFLVTTDWLEKNLNNPKLRLIEVSVDTGVYERGHIQGAVNFKWHTDLIVPAVTFVASGVKGLFSASHFFLPPSSNLTFFTP